MSVYEYAYMVMSEVCVYTFRNLSLCVMFVHCLIGYDTESAYLWACVSVLVCTPVFVSEHMSFISIMSCKCVSCIYADV